MQCRLNQEKYLRKYSVKKHKEKPDRVYLAYKKVDNNRIEKEKRKVANDYLTQTKAVEYLTTNIFNDILKIGLDYKLTAVWEAI